MQTVTVELTKEKECKHSIRFDTADSKAPISSVYVMRTMPGIDTAKKITVTIQVKE